MSSAVINIDPTDIKSTETCPPPSSHLCPLACQTLPHRQSHLQSRHLQSVEPVVHRSRANPHLPCQAFAREAR